MNPIITSILDNDLYKFTMRNAVMKNFAPDTQVTYQFNNRNKLVKFSQSFVDSLIEQIELMKELQLNDSEYLYLQQTFPFFDKEFLNSLKSYRFDPKEIFAFLDNDNNLQITITGTWASTILWEVPLMAIISELYFTYKPLFGYQLEDYYIKTKEKFITLSQSGCKFSDFGTRRRRSHHIQSMVVNTFAAMASETPGFFMGTSNVYFAMINHVPCMGTMAHEWIMGNSAFSLENAHTLALGMWAKTYEGKLGIALSDTFTTEAFFRDFNGYYARLYDGVRHDSGDAVVFADKVIAHYTKLGIDPLHKKIVFSDGLSPSECVKLQNYCEGKIQVMFGIGTNFTNHQIDEHKPLNMVIKLRTVGSTEVVKISDNMTKATGEAQALAKAFQVFVRK